MPMTKDGMDTPIIENMVQEAGKRAALADRGIDAQRNADGKRDDGGDEDELERRREALGDQRHHVLLVAIGDAEIAMKRIA